MKYNTINVTFWFDEIENFKNYQNILDFELGKFFTPFNLTGVPINVDPIFPRINAVTLGGHTVFNMSKINVQISTDFDGEYVDDFEKCFSYIRDKSFKVFEILTSKCNLKILYSAVQINCEYSDDNPVKRIAENLFKDSILKDKLCEIGAKITEKVDDKYYFITSVNDAKVVSIVKKIDQNVKNQNIILPLISEKDVEIEKKVLAVVREINDKYSFNTVDNYSSNKESFGEMLGIFYDKVRYLLEEIENNKLI